MPVEKFDLLRRRMLAHVREEYTDTAQIHLHEAAWRATEFHAKTRLKRGADGKPRVMYVFHSANMGGGEIQLWRRMRLIRTYGIEPIIVLPGVLKESEQVAQLKEQLLQENLQLEFVDYTCFTEPRSPDDFFSEFEKDQIRGLIERCGPSLVHTVTFIPSFGQVCTELNIPHVASLYAVEDDFAWSNGYPGFKHCDIVESDSFRYAQRWGTLLDSIRYCSRQLVPESLFSIGTQKYLDRIGEPPASLKGPIHLVVTGTVQERKCQLETIQAVEKLIEQGLDLSLDLYGYTQFFPKYVEKCQKAIDSAGLKDRIRFCGFKDDVTIIMQNVDVLLSLSAYESFPSSIKEAMATGVLVVATPVGGVAELIIDKVSGILCSDVTVDAMVDGIRRALELSPEDRSQIIEQARRVARSEFHPFRAANDLLEEYNRAIDNVQHTASVDPIRKSGQSSRQTIVKSPRGEPTNIVKVNGILRNILIPDRENLCGLDVMVGLFEKMASGFIILQIFDRNGRGLRKAIFDLGRAQDNQFISFKFDAIQDLSLKPLTLQFHLVEKGKGTLVGLYENVPPPEGVDRLLRRIKTSIGFPITSHGLYCRKHYGVP
jgi:glycosyltransferase involved in cell wall biosynthesis